MKRSNDTMNHSHNQTLLITNLTKKSKRQEKDYAFEPMMTMTILAPFRLTATHNVEMMHLSTY